tara:strand:- start:116 stop:919 length:804 start_codon:yes stop_codon:yes gene_type:complete
MSNSLKVEPVKIDEKLLNKVEHGIWEFPSLHLIVGKIASGKSTFLHNIITRFYEPVFKQNIILFSPTARNDPIMNTLIEGDKIFVHFTEFNNEIAKRVLEVIKEDDDPKSRWLIILDDAMGMIPPTNSREARWFNKWIANFRHEPVEGKVSIIISIQKFSSVNNVVRSNLHYIYLLGKASEKELKQYSEEMNAISGGSSEKFLQLYHKSKEGDHPYHFMTLDFKKLRVLKDFDELLFDGLNNQDVSNVVKNENKNMDINNKDDEEKE